MQVSIDYVHGVFPISITVRREDNYNITMLEGEVFLTPSMVQSIEFKFDVRPQSLSSDFPGSPIVFMSKSTKDYIESNPSCKHLFDEAKNAAKLICQSYYLTMVEAYRFDRYDDLVLNALSLGNEALLTVLLNMIPNEYTGNAERLLSSIVTAPQYANLEAELPTKSEAFKAGLAMLLIEINSTADRRDDKTIQAYMDNLNPLSGFIDQHQRAAACG